MTALVHGLLRQGQVLDTLGVLCPEHDYAVCMAEEAHTTQDGSIRRCYATPDCPSESRYLRQHRG